MEPDTSLSLLSAAFLIIAGIAYIQKKRTVLTADAILFFPICSASLIWNWWTVSPILTVILLFLTLGVSCIALIFFLIDLIWAPFGTEMTYLTFLCWILCPLAVLLNFIGLAL